MFYRYSCAIQVSERYLRNLYIYQYKNGQFSHYYTHPQTFSKDKFSIDFSTITMGEAQLRRSRRLVGHLPEISETFAECFICLEKMELCFPVVVRLPYCQNFCHRQELGRWLDTNNSCPLCRAVIEVEQPNVPQDEAFHISLNEREALAGRVLNQ